MGRLATLVATCFGVGRLPLAPGTWGSLAALPVAALIVFLAGKGGLLVAAALLFFAGWWAAQVHVSATGVEDPGEVVVDEVVGQWLVLLAVPLTGAYYLTAFAVFRAFDIVKPWPANQIDRKIKGGLGVMLDDVAAAIYGFVVMAAARAVLEVV